MTTQGQETRFRAVVRNQLINEPGTRGDSSQGHMLKGAVMQASTTRRLHERLVMQAAQ